MLTGEIRNQIDRIWDSFWSGGISNPLEVIAQITYLLFLKRLDDLETAEGLKANVGINARNRTHVYASTPKRCRDCSRKVQCTRGQTRILQIYVHAGARQRARERAKTPEFGIALRARKKVEALFAELKNQIGLRRLRLRRMKFVREQFFLAAAAQNLKRLVRFLARTTLPPAEVTA